MKAFVSQQQDLLAEAQELLKARDLNAAWSAFASAELAGLSPDCCAAGRWMIDMLQGDFEAAWGESDVIRAHGEPDPHRFWTGEDFTGKRVMLRCLHGFGDTVQFMRYAPRIAARASRLVVEVAPAMLELTKLFLGEFDVITWGADAPMKEPEWDVQMEINELPYIFRTQASQLPLATRYLKIDPQGEKRDACEKRSVENLRVGLVWASGEWNPERSVPFALIEQLLSVHGVEFWNLQGGAARAEWRRIPEGSLVHAADECKADLVQLARRITELDLVITPDTLAAHLAGALGTPAWVMLNYAADWRWQHARNDSPWYPSLRLFRQADTRDWSGVVEAVRREVEGVAAGRARAHRTA